MLKWDLSIFLDIYQVSVLAYIIIFIDLAYSIRDFQVKLLITRYEINNGHDGSYI